MEKIEKNKRFEDFPSATLYLDDIAEILETLQNVCEKVEVKTEDYKISGLDELDALASKFPNGRFGNIYIVGLEPHVTIDLRAYGVSAYVSDDNLELRGVVSKVRDIVQRGKKVNLHFGWLFIALTFVAVAVAASQFMSKEYVTGSLLALLSVASILISVRYIMKNTLVVRSQPRGSVKTFFERTKDDIALIIISVTFGGIMTYLFTKLLP